MDNQTKNYFKLFYDWSTKDIKECLKLKSNAGPVLVMVVNGIDILGGMCYGFKKDNSKERSIKFMKNKMGVAKPVAQLLYENIRCGMIHQGAPKGTPEMGVEFYIQQDDDITNKEKFFCKNIEKNYLRLNVSAFAFLYIDTINKIDSDIEEHIHYNPLPKTEEEKKKLKDMLISATECVKNECTEDEMKSKSSSLANTSTGSSGS